MATKAELRVIDAEPLGDGIIERLERALELARKGELSSIAIALVYRDGAAGAIYSEAPSLSCMIGSIARLQHTIITRAEQS